MLTIALGCLVLALAVATPVDVDTLFEPARVETVEMPAEPPMVLGGGQVLLELRVDRSGRVADVRVLTSTPPFTELVKEAVSQWHFSPAREVLGQSEGESDVESRVLVAGVFRPPTLYDSPSRGEPVENVAKPSEEVPFPTSMSMPAYPPRAHWHMSRSILVEADLGEEGELVASKVIRSSAGLDEVALDAIHRWSFRPAKRNGTPVPSVAYIIFGFREPVVSGRSP
jgi:TonB family protein